METLRDLMDPGMYLPALVAGLAVVVMCGVLSVLVVVKRLGFVGQGVSHSAFGGIGVAAVLGGLGLAPDGGLAQYAVIIGFCVLAALGIAAVSDRRTVPMDTAIGLFLVGSMALGAVLAQLGREIAQRAGRAPSFQSWDAWLFGSILVANRTDAAVGLGLAAVVLAVAWWFRRPMLFWVFEEDSARAFGVNAGLMKVALMVLLALAVVVAMKLVGVVLATALLVLPGATALKLSDRLGRVTLLSVAIAVVGLVAGLVASIELNWQAGPTVVLVLTAAFGAAVGWRALRTAAA